MSDKRQSDDIGQLVKALVSAQSEMTNPPKDSVNPHFKSKYADLATVLDGIRPILSKHGLGILQWPSGGERGPVLHTMLMHTSGQWLTPEPFEIPAQQMNPQGYGSALTYARRYVLQALAGVTGDADDDGHTASQPQRPPKRREEQRPAPANGVKPTQKAEQALPENGEQLLDRLNQFGDKLVQAGLCKPGELIRHIRMQAREKGVAADLIDWEADQIKWAVEEATRFQRVRRAAKEQPAEASTQA